MAARAINSNGESYSGCETVTPNDNADLPNVSKGIYIGGAGNLAVIMHDDTSVVTLTGLLVGWFYPFRCKRIKSTNTTATNIIALF